MCSKGVAKLCLAPSQLRSAACSLLLLLPGAFFFPMGYVRSVLLLLAGSAVWPSARLAVPELSACASSGRAWRPSAAQRSQGRARPTGHPASASGARASRLQCRRPPYTWPILGSVLLVLFDSVVMLPLLHATLRPRKRALTAAPAAPWVGTPLIAPRPRCSTRRVRGRCPTTPSERLSC